MDSILVTRDRPSLYDLPEYNSQRKLCFEWENQFNCEDQILIEFEKDSDQNFESQNEHSIMSKPHLLRNWTTHPKSQQVNKLDHLGLEPKLLNFNDFKWSANSGGFVSDNELSFLFENGS